MKNKRINRRLLRNFGYPADQQGIINRYLRERGQWDNHLWRCRKYINETVRYYKPPLVTILGSGWLLDIPLEELAGKCRKVNLVDLMHPRQVKHKVSKLGNVKLYEQDISGGLLKEIWRSYREGGDVNSIRMPLYEPGFEAGMVFSVNILTQLDSLPADYLVRKKVMTYKELRQLRQGMQRSHIRYLEASDSVLISDYIEYLKTENRVTECNELLFSSLPEGRRIEEWIWDFDNSGNYYSGKRVSFGVKAIDLVK